MEFKRDRERGKPNEGAALRSNCERSERREKTQGVSDGGKLELGTAAALTDDDE